MNKKGSIVSIFVFLVVVVVIAIIFYFLFTLNNNLFSEIDQEELTSTYANESVNTFERTSVPLGDTMVLIVFFGLVVSLIVTAVYTDFHPVVMGILVILFIIFGVAMSMFLTDSYDDLSDSLGDEISGGKTFTFSNALFGKYFPIVMVFIVVVFIMILYAKRSGGGGF